MRRERARTNVHVHVKFSRERRGSELCQVEVASARDERQKAMCQQWVDGTRDLRQRHGAWQTWAHGRCHRGATGKERA